MIYDIQMECKIKKFYYNQIITNLQNGWIEYLNNRTMQEWLSDNESSIDYEYDYNDDYNHIYNDDYDYEWYNHCWKDWIKLNYID